MVIVVLAFNFNVLVEQFIFDKEQTKTDKFHKEKVVKRDIDSTYQD